MVTRDYIGFYLNGEFVKVSGEDVFLPLADYLRKIKNLTGTKIVCAEGDCGACTVLVGRIQDTLTQKSDKIFYKSANSCIQFLGLLDGSHVVTVEGLKNKAKNELHPVQEKMLECHGAQCGYCTPGFICAMTAMVEDVKNEKQDINIQKAKNHLTGNLCRCTGYEPILNAALAIDAKNSPRISDLYPCETEMIRTLTKLIELPVHIKFSGKNLRDEWIVKEFFLPTTVEEALLYKSQNPESKIISGATDLGVLSNKGKVHLVQKFSLNNVLSAYNMEKVIDNGKEFVKLGAKVSLTESEKILKDDFSDFSRLLHIFASPQIKNQGTLVGNLANASPIGDAIPFLNVAEAMVVTGAIFNGKIEQRKINVHEFIIAYKKLDLSPSELILAVQIPRTSSKFKLFKASLRKDLDISQVTFAARYDIFFDNKSKKFQVSDLEIAFGGMSEKVERVAKITQILKKDFSQDSLELAKRELSQQFSPFSDVRASSRYRLGLAKNFLQKFYDEIHRDYLHTVEVTL